jgi:hypothetical protein
MESHFKIFEPFTLKVSPIAVVGYRTPRRFASQHAAKERASVPECASPLALSRGRINASEILAGYFQLWFAHESEDASVGGAHLVGTARCAVRAVFSGATWGVMNAVGPHDSARYYAGGDIAGAMSLPI